MKPTSYLYLIARDLQDVNMGEAAGFVVIAKTSTQAYDLIQRARQESNALEPGNEGPDVWLPGKAACTKLGVAEDPTPRIILRDFHAG